MVVKFDLDNLMINNYNKKHILVITTSAKENELKQLVDRRTDRQTESCKAIRPHFKGSMIVM